MLPRTGLHPRDHNGLPTPKDLPDGLLHPFFSVPLHLHTPFSPRVFLDPLAIMQYVPFASDIEIPFYASLASHKINHDKLDDSARKLLGLYEIRSSDPKENSCRMQIHGNALTSDEYVLRRRAKTCLLT